MCQQDDLQGILFPLPPVSETKSTENADELSKIFVDSSEYPSMDTQDRPVFELTLMFNGRVTRKTWQLPIPWFNTQVDKDILAEFASSAREDVKKGL